MSTAKNDKLLDIKNKNKLLPADVKKIKKHYETLDNPLLNDSSSELMDPSNFKAIDVFETPYYPYHKKTFDAQKKTKAKEDKSIPHSYSKEKDQTKVSASDNATTANSLKMTNASATDSIQQLKNIILTSKKSHHNESTEQSKQLGDIKEHNESGDAPERTNSNLGLKLVEKGRKKSRRYDAGTSKDILGSNFQEIPRLIIDDRPDSSLPDFLLISSKKRKVGKGIEFESIGMHQKQASLGLERDTNTTPVHRVASRDQKVDENLFGESQGLPPWNKESENMPTIKSTVEANKKPQKIEALKRPIVNKSSTDKKFPTSQAINGNENVAEKPNRNENSNERKKSSASSMLFGFVEEDSDSKKPAKLTTSPVENNRRKSRRDMLPVPVDSDEDKQLAVSQEQNEEKKSVQKTENTSDVAKANTAGKPRKPSITVVTAKEDKKEIKYEEIPENLSDSTVGFIRNRHTTQASTFGNQADKEARRMLVAQEAVLDASTDKRGSRSEIKNKHKPRGSRAKKDSLATQIVVPPPQTSYTASKEKKPVVITQPSLLEKVARTFQPKLSQKEAIHKIITNDNTFGDPADPKYLLWKKHFIKIINRAKSDGADFFAANEDIDSAEKKSLASFVIFLIRRNIRRRKTLTKRNLDRIKEKNKKSTNLVFGIKKRSVFRTGIASAQLDPEQISRVPWWIIYPHSPLRRAWDAIIILCVFYNLFFIPLDLSLDFDMSFGRNVLEIFIEVLFWIDITLNFLTGYIDSKHQLVMDIKKIRMNYLKTWFAFDFLATFPFVNIINTFGTSFGSNANIFQLSRLPRILRLGKILKFLENIRGAIVWRILRLFLLFFLVSHWVGCLYYLILELNLYPNNFYLRYTYALFMGLEMMVGENVEVANNVERIFATIVLMLGQGISATIFGSMASLVKNIDKGYDMFTTKMDFVNEHMRYYHLPNELQQDIRMYYDYIWSRHRELIYGQEHLALLDKQLAEEMQAHRYKEIIGSVEILKKASSSFVGKIIIYLKPQIITPGEMIYSEGELTHGLYILERGTVELFSHTTKQLYEKVDSISYFGLETLLMKTARHWCSALSRHYVDLQRIDFGDFRLLVADYPQEGANLLLISKRRAAKFEILTNKKIFNMITVPSSKSVGRNYEEVYTQDNIWLNLSIDYSKVAAEKAKVLANMDRDSIRRRGVTAYKSESNSPTRLGSKRITKSPGAVLDNSPSSALLSSIEESRLTTSRTKNKKATEKTQNSDLAKVIDESLESQADYVERKFREVFDELDTKLRNLEDRFA